MGTSVVTVVKIMTAGTGNTGDIGYAELQCASSIAGKASEAVNATMSTRSPWLTDTLERLARGHSSQELDQLMPFRARGGHRLLRIRRRLPEAYV